MKRALLVMHYGTPASMDDVLPYYTHIRRGNRPTEEQLEDLKSRYLAIGGPSPLNDISHRQAEAIQLGLAARGIEAGLYIGQKHAHPFIEEVVEQMANDGVEEAIGVVLAPHYSRTSVGAYTKYAQDARDKFAPKMKLQVVERWGAMPALIEGLSDRVRFAAKGLNLDETLVIFSAHSLPERAVAGGDPYQPELLETSRLVAEAAGVPHWTFGFQSASSTGEPWIGPDVLDVIRKEAVGKYKAVICCTVGFVSDHLEVLYDLGIEAKEEAESAGLEFRRAACINDDAQVMDALAAMAASRMGELAAV
jgi:protoporphyrin/coproporphyrin ferrochelatase